METQSGCKLKIIKIIIISLCAGQNAWVLGTSTHGVGVVSLAIGSEAGEPLAQPMFISKPEKDNLNKRK